MTATIGFNRPAMPPAAYDYLREAVRNMHLSGDGPFTRRCHALLESLLGVPKVLLTTSCTHALEMAALLLNVRPGDEVIVPSVHVRVHRQRLRPAGGDGRCSPTSARTRSTWTSGNSRGSCHPRTRASSSRCITPGWRARLDAICRIGRGGQRVAVVEDNAHGLFGTYRGRPLGTFGCLATQSFHETKNISCGEGGALVVNDRDFAERAEIIREKGTNRSRFFRGEVDKYTWVDVGSSYLPSDALAALLLAQLEIRDDIQARRRAIWDRYRSELREWANTNCSELPTIPDHCEHPAHLFYVLLPCLDDRQAFLAHLRARGVVATFHYVPLHLSEMGGRFGGRAGDCPVTEAVSDRLVRLPLFFDLTDADQTRVIDAVKAFRVPAGRERFGDYVARMKKPHSAAA